MDKPIVQKIVLAAVIVHQGKVLILQRSQDETTLPGLWELPSGKREPMEKSEDALVREVREETGLNVKIKGIVSVFDYQVEKSDQIRDTTQINFLAEVATEPQVVISPEHQAEAWISKDELNNYNISNTVKEVLNKTFAKL